MKKLIPAFLFAFFGALAIVEPAFAQAADQAVAEMPNWGAGISKGMAAGLAVIGAGIGIGKIGGDANSAIARQPESTGDIRGSSLIFAALIEGVAFFGVVVGLLFAIK